MKWDSVRATDGRRTAQRLGAACLIAVSVLILPSPAQAEEAVVPAAESAGVTVWLKDIGRAIGLAFRDIGLEGKRIGLAIGHTAAGLGKEIGQGAVTAGKEVGQAAKEGGKAFGKALTGKSEGGSEQALKGNGEAKSDNTNTP